MLTNPWDRQRNKKAQEKKERAKDHAFARIGNFGIESSTIGEVVWVGKKGCSVKVLEEVLDTSIDQSLTQVVVGDVVFLRDGQVVGIAPRRTFIARMRKDGTRFGSQSHAQVVVANIDKAVIVASLVKPDFHPRFVDRYLIACQQGGVEPVICITKADLSLERVRFDGYQKNRVKVFITSTKTGEGIEALKNYVTGSKIVFVGASGVGKSSLTNALVMNEVASTQGISDQSSRGRHTTTASQMYEWAPDSYCIDTPGIRSLGLENMPKEEIQYYFPEFEEFRNNCKFSNCTHSHEPGCAVQEAVKSGIISAERYESYVRMYTE